MLRFRLVLTFALLASTFASAAPPPTAMKRTGVMLIPMDRGAEAKIVQLETFIYEALERLRRFPVVRSEHLFQIPEDEEGKEMWKRAEQGYRASRQAYKARDYADAELKLEATLKAFIRAASAMDRCLTLCDAYALYATVLHRRGKKGEAERAMLNLLSLRPSYELQPKFHPKEMFVFKRQVASSKPAKLRATMTFHTEPEGARIVIDGEPAGFTPLTVPAMSAGLHLVRVERPGFVQDGRLIEVTPLDGVVNIKLRPSAAYKAWDATIDPLLADLRGGDGSRRIAGLGKSMNLQRAIIGIVRTVRETETVDVDLGYYNLKTGKKLSSKRAAFQGDVFGELENELGRVVVGLVNAADGQVEPVAQTEDPLDSRHGMEDWPGEQRRLPDGQDRRWQKSTDPLDGRTGTEEW